MNRNHDNPEPRIDAAGLSRDVEPPAALEDRTVAALARAGLLGRARFQSTTALLSAAAVAILAIGFVLGRASQDPNGPTHSSPRYLLLLEGGREALDAAEEARTVEAYRAWAVSLRREGRLVTGERLGAEAAAVPFEASTIGGDLRGFFIISAATIEEATAVAGSCPHTSRGGRVIVRPIDPT